MSGTINQQQSVTFYKTCILSYNTGRTSGLTIVAG